MDDPTKDDGKPRVMPGGSNNPKPPRKDEKPKKAQGGNKNPQPKHA